MERKKKKGPQCTYICCKNTKVTENLWGRHFLVYMHMCMHASICVLVFLCTYVPYNLACLCENRSPGLWTYIQMHSFWWKGQTEQMGNLYSCLGKGAYTSHSCDTLHTFTRSDVRRLKIVPSPSWHLVAVSCQDFLGHTEGVPFHIAICLIVVIQQSCSGTSELSDLPTSSGWLGSGKSSNSVWLGVCSEKVTLVPLVALYCLCCQKKALQVKI